jgi:hypothetical protein
MNTVKTIVKLHPINGNDLIQKEKLKGILNREVDPQVGNDVMKNMTTFRENCQKNFFSVNETQFLLCLLEPPTEDIPSKNVNGLSPNKRNKMENRNYTGIVLSNTTV